MHKASEVTFKSSSCLLLNTANSHLWRVRKSRFFRKFKMALVFLWWKITS